MVDSPADAGRRLDSYIFDRSADARTVRNIYYHIDDQADTLEMKVRKSGLSGAEWQVESI
jgi:hypothetical protein